MIEQLIKKAAELRASDVHIAFNQIPKMRVDGEIRDIPEEPVLSDADCESIAKELLGREMPKAGEIDLAAHYAGRRIRGNIYRQSGHVSVALRILRDVIPELENLGLPKAVETLPELHSGIVLVTGETGSGKSTTLASLLNRINRDQHRHIITLEDPMEYIYKSDKSLIEQREIGKDTASYAMGLRAILREDPDVILIGEMRDLETIETALTAAETGHLVFATLHTNSAADSIDRIVDVFPAERQKQIRMQLSTTLQAVLSQQLVKKIGGGRVAVCEMMVINPAIRSLIREGKTPQIDNALGTSAGIGSVSMDSALLKLYKDRVIDSETVKKYCRDKEFIAKTVRF